MELFTKEFEEININFDIIPDTEKDIIINNFKKIKYPPSKKIDIKEILNIKIFQ
jgi:hypothetical protein